MATFDFRRPHNAEAELRIMLAAAAIQAGGTLRFDDRVLDLAKQAFGTVGVFRCGVCDQCIRVRTSPNLQWDSREHGQVRVGLAEILRHHMEKRGLHGRIAFGHEPAVGGVGSILVLRGRVHDEQLREPLRVHARGMSERADKQLHRPVNQRSTKSKRHQTDEEDHRNRSRTFVGGVFRADVPHPVHE